MPALCTTAFTIMLTGISWSPAALEANIPCYDDEWSCNFAAANMNLAFIMDRIAPPHRAQCKPTEDPKEKQTP